MSDTDNCFSYNRVSVTAAKSNFPHFISSPVVEMIHIPSFMVTNDDMRQWTVPQMSIIIIYNSTWSI